LGQPQEERRIIAPLLSARAPQPAAHSTAASFLSPRDDLHRSYPRAERPQNNISPVLLLPVGS